MIVTILAFVSVFFGIVFLILGFILNHRYNNFQEICTQIVKGKVIMYPKLEYVIDTYLDNRLEYFPTIEYEVNNIKYTQKLKYKTVMTIPSFPSDKDKFIDEFDIYGTHLTVYRTIGFNLNSLKEKLPVGSEIDVYYNPTNPKMSYVLRYIKDTPFISLLFICAAIFIVFGMMVPMFFILLTAGNI